MRPLVIAALLLTSTAASAAPLLGSTASVYEGSFCKKYGCNLIDVVISEDEKLYTYALQSGINLEIIRQSNKSITSSALYGMSRRLNTSVINDFTRSFLGVTFETSAVKKCIDTANPVLDNHFFSGLINGHDYRVGCEQPVGSSPIISFYASFVKYF